MARIGALRQPILSCNGCGCDDRHPCITEGGPCAWFMLSIDGPSGLCTACAEELGYEAFMYRPDSLDEDEAA